MIISDRSWFETLDLSAQSDTQLKLKIPYSTFFYEYVHFPDHLWTHDYEQVRIKTCFSHTQEAD